jgi:hypothetical protein
MVIIYEAPNYTIEIQEITSVINLIWNAVSINLNRSTDDKLQEIMIQLRKANGESFI